MSDRVDICRGGKHCSIMIVGDSLSAKRGDGILWENRWPQVLEKFAGKHAEIVNRSRRAATSRTLLHQDLKNVDLVVIQLGIVDCVPRYFTELESKWISRIPRRARSRVISYFKKKRRQEQHRAYVSASEYKRNLEMFLDRCGRAVVIKILEPGKKFYRSNPGAVESIRVYNGLIDDLRCRYADLKVLAVPAELVDSLTLEDGYHFNEEGHFFLAELLAVELGFGLQDSTVEMPG